ncbi:hypothetical protein PVA45_07790 (plasmid) [Entomospira entomophila]|uniref:Uncharacterized protein n=1 Tax=Entomospira entomophila TaxID=2719988 RepID=A0A968GA53_9SPIO|nr:hypothetical protein [Entomospira entomophilus]NIZ41405.1 hypothetical protein [Entomospira entomophilus]WDI36355.1 hypothetical protein PVA45_07790 [Entomospira entomophilus]
MAKLSEIRLPLKPSSSRAITRPRRSIVRRSTVMVSGAIPPSQVADRATTPIAPSYPSQRAKRAVLSDAIPSLASIDQLWQAPTTLKSHSLQTPIASSTIVRSTSATAMPSHQNIPETMRSNKNAPKSSADQQPPLADDQRPTKTDQHHASIASQPQFDHSRQSQPVITAQSDRRGLPRRDDPVVTENAMKRSSDHQINQRMLQQILHEVMQLRPLLDRTEHRHLL